MGTIIIILLGVAIVIATPVLIYKTKANQTKKEKLEVLKNFAINAGYRITESDIIENICLGIDRQTKMFFYVNVAIKKELMVDLKLFKQCKIYEVSRSENTYNGRSKVLEKIELQFIPKDSKSSSEILEFFNAQNGMFQLSEELLYARKWEEIINGIIVNKKK